MQNNSYSASIHILNGSNFAKAFNFYIFCIKIFFYSKLCVDFLDNANFPYHPNVTRAHPPTAYTHTHTHASIRIKYLVPPMPNVHLAGRTESCKVNIVKYF